MALAFPLVTVLEVTEVPVWVVPAELKTVNVTVPSLTVSRPLVGATRALRVTLWFAVEKGTLASWAVVAVPAEVTANVSGLTERVRA